MLFNTTHLTGSDVEGDVDDVDAEVEQEGDGDIQAGVTADDFETPEGPPKDGKLKKPLLSHEYSDNTPRKKKLCRALTSLAAHQTPSKQGLAWTNAEGWAAQTVSIVV